MVRRVDVGNCGESSVFGEERASNSAAQHRFSLQSDTYAVVLFIPWEVKPSTLRAIPRVRCPALLTSAGLSPGIARSRRRWEGRRYQDAVCPISVLLPISGSLSLLARALFVYLSRAADEVDRQ